MSRASFIDESRSRVLWSKPWGDDTGLFSGVRLSRDASEYKDTVSIANADALLRRISGLEGWTLDGSFVVFDTTSDAVVDALFQASQHDVLDQSIVDEIEDEMVDIFIEEEVMPEVERIVTSGFESAGEQWRLEPPHDWREALREDLRGCGAVKVSGVTVRLDDGYLCLRLAEWATKEESVHMASNDSWHGAAYEHPCDRCDYNGRYCSWPDVDPAVMESGDCPILSVLNASPSDLAEDEDLAALREEYVDEYGASIGLKASLDTPDQTAWILDVSKRVSVSEPQVDIEAEAKRLVEGMSLDDISSAQNVITAATAYIRTYKNKAAIKEAFLEAAEKQRRLHFNLYYRSGSMVELPNESLFS